MNNQIKILMINPLSFCLPCGSPLAAMQVGVYREFKIEGKPLVLTF
jgi:hypothetical protein